jgi:choice-of-anchor A domain-containing protein
VRENEGIEMKRLFFSSLVAVMSVVFSAGMACATSLSAEEILQQFNVVVLDDATSTSHVDGRAYVGGNLTGGTYVQHPADTPASAYAGLTVGGTASGVTVNSDGAVIEGNLSGSTINSGSTAVFGTASNTNFNGPAYVATTGSGDNFNGGQNASLATGTAATAATSTDFKSALTGLSSQLKNLASTGSYVTFVGTKAIFNAVLLNGVAVFDLTSIDKLLFTMTEFEFNLNGATTVILNSDETTINISANFLGGSAQAIGAKTIWNFYDATDVDITSQFGGSIVAPLADFTNNNNIEGGVYVDTLHQYGEIHEQSFTGEIPSTPVPEPSTMLLLGLGLTGLALVRSRRGKR